MTDVIIQILKTLTPSARFRPSCIFLHNIIISTLSLLSSYHSHQSECMWLVVGVSSNKGGSSLLTGTVTIQVCCLITFTLSCSTS